MLPVAILAGGVGTRLGMLTAKKPKVLVSVAGKPFLFHQLDYLERQGVERIVICTGYRGEMVEQAVRQWRTSTQTITFSQDGKTSLGTAGAVRKALPLLGEEFFVLYGDVYIDCQLGAVQRAFRDSGKQALMTVYRCPQREANVVFSHGSIWHYDKFNPDEAMTHCDYGLGILSQSVLLADDAADLADVYGHMGTDLAGYEMPSAPHEIGSFEGLYRARQYLA